MRTTGDRIRHTILFEAFLLALCIPLLSLILQQPPIKMGLMGIFFSITAMTLNYLYNLFFDKALMRLGKPLYPRGWRLRTLHALLFEFGFIFITVPVVMVWLNYTFWQALALDVGFLIFIPIYTYIYNWLYDWVFPPKLVS